MFVYTILPAESLVGVILLVVFISHLLRDIASERMMEKHIRRIGICSIIVFASLIVQRMFPVAVAFLLAVLLLMLIILSHAKSLAKRSTSGSGAPTSKMISLEKYARHIRSKPLVKRILKLAGVVNSIRSIEGYTAKTLSSQNADIIKMEKVYLPRIEGLLSQYLKISSHDQHYDTAKLS